MDKLPRLMLQEMEEILLPLPWGACNQYSEGLWIYYNSFVRLFLSRWVAQPNNISIKEYIGTTCTILTNHELLSEEETLSRIQDWYLMCHKYWPTYK